MYLKNYFNPLPPRRGRQFVHVYFACSKQFQSTPSSQRETIRTCILRLLQAISIHSLLAEGDNPYISESLISKYFNPLPPRRGRQSGQVYHLSPDIFQSTPSSQRETQAEYEKTHTRDISIHSLLAEGDSKNAQKYLLPTYILHTKPIITQANPSLKLIFSNLFSKLTPFSRCESPTHFMCTYHSHLNHISNFFKPAPGPQLFPLFRYFDPG